MITLKDIAAITGVSINTVSRALMDKPDIGAKTKSRVRKAAETLGYTPNIMARGLALKRSFTIGLIATELSNPARGALIEKLRRTAAVKGYQLLVEGYANDIEAATVIREMCSRGVDGLLLGNIEGILSERSFWPALETAESGGTPVVAFYHAVTTKVDNVVLNFSRLTEELTAHLIHAHGLKNILFAAASMDYERGNGYKRAMAAAGLERHVGLIRLPGWDMADAKRGMMDFLGVNPAPEAVVCHNDMTAAGIMSGLRGRGLRIPEDTAVVGVDNIEFSEYLNPTLTTAGAEPSKVAGELFRLLIERIEGGHSGESRRVELPFELFFRESCGCGVKP